MALFFPQRLTDSETEALVKNKLNWILEASIPQIVYLFGSAAKNNLTENSDIDFALIYQTDDEIKTAKQRIWPRPRNDDWPIELLFFTLYDFTKKSSIGGVCMDIKSFGKIIFTKDKVA